MGVEVIQVCQIHQSRLQDLLKAKAKLGSPHAGRLAGKKSWRARSISSSDQPIFFQRRTDRLNFRKSRGVTAAPLAYWRAVPLKSHPVLRSARTRTFVE